MRSDKGEIDGLLLDEDFSYPNIEFPDPKSLREVEVYDYSMSELKIDIEGLKAEYNWMMLVDEQQDFEEKIKKIVGSCKL